MIKIRLIKGQPLHPEEKEIWVQPVDPSVVIWAALASSFSLAEASRFLHHVAAWRHLVAAGLSQAIILEEELDISSYQQHRLPRQMDLVKLSSSDQALGYWLSGRMAERLLQLYDQPMYVFPKKIQTIGDVFSLASSHLAAFPQWPSNGEYILPQWPHLNPNEMILRLGQWFPPAVEEWLSWDPVWSDGASQVSLFHHLWLYRCALAIDIDSIVVLDPVMQLGEDFDDRLDECLEVFESPVVLLSHYVINWEKVSPVELLPDGNALCQFEKDVYGEFAYLITREYMESLLHRFDRVWRYLPSSLDVFEEIIGSTSATLLQKPLAYRLDTANYRAYFSYYGF